MSTADYLTNRKLTILNPDGVTYRMPLKKAGTMRLEGEDDGMTAFGDAVDKLGQIESLGFSMKELRELAKQRGKIKT